MEVKKMIKRKPDFVIGDASNPYLLRWFIIPRNKFFNIYLHKFCKSDDDRALHDHPWLFNISILLSGEYIEHKFVNNDESCIKTYSRKRKRFLPYFRWGDSPHRVELLKGIKPYGKCDTQTVELPVWTLFITGATVRRWGFYCHKGWKYWRDFVAQREGGNSRGEGCGDE